MTGGLESRRVLVVGGASGIGAAIAYAFRDAGSHVLTADLRGAGLTVDVTDEDSVRAMASAAGAVDVLVNSAGILTESPMVEMSLAQWQQTIDVDLTGIFLACRHVVPGMVDRGWGRVVNVASQLGIKGGVGMGHYSAAKAGVIGFTMSCAAWAAPYGVRVNAVAPGMIDTDVHRDLSPEQLRELERGVPLGRLGTPEETAEAILFLASDASRYITGTVLDVNGGLHMG